MPRGVRECLITQLLAMGVRADVCEVLFPQKGVLSTPVQSAMDRLFRVVAGECFQSLQAKEGRRPDSDILARAIDAIIGQRPIPEAGNHDLGIVNGVVRAFPIGDRGKARQDAGLEKRRETRKRRATRLTDAIRREERKKLKILETTEEEGSSDGATGRPLQSSRPDRSPQAALGVNPEEQHQPEAEKADPEGEEGDLPEGDAEADGADEALEEAGDGDEAAED